MAGKARHSLFWRPGAAREEVSREWPLRVRDVLTVLKKTGRVITNTCRLVFAVQKQPHLRRDREGDHSHLSESAEILSARVKSVRGLCREGTDFGGDSTDRQTLVVCRVGLCFVAIADVAAAMSAFGWGKLARGAGGGRRRKSCSEELYEVSMRCCEEEKMKSDRVNKESGCAADEQHAVSNWPA